MSDAADRAEAVLNDPAVDRLLADVENLRVIVQDYEVEEAPVPTGQETRVVDPETGGAKGSKLARFDLLPWDVLWNVAEHFGRGARKYEDRNWERGYKWSLSAAAQQRHFSQFWNGEEIDNDPALYLDGEPHTVRHSVANAWHALVLAAFDLRRIGTDDRPKLWVAQ